MAGKPQKPKTAVSPVNGVPTPRGRPFTQETAREARQKRENKEKARKSITEAFKRRMTESITLSNGNTISFWVAHRARQ